VADYVLDPPFMAGNAYFIMNLDVWNDMPENLQDLLMEILMDQRKQYQADWDKQVAATRQKALDNGMEFIKFSDADAKAYFNGIYEETWKESEKQYGDAAPKLRKLLGQ
jgi:TRAP-type C4-dicarboxylate transport system substrate-binding protein